MIRREPLPVAFASWSYPGLVALFATGTALWALIIYAAVVLAF
jgi:hypothetical protein